MNKVLHFLQEERLYIVILIFVLLFNVIMLLHNEPKGKAKKVAGAAAVSPESHRSSMEELLRKDERLVILFSLASLLMFAVFLLGLVIGLLLSSSIIKGTLDIRTHSPPIAQWNMWDVCKVVLLFVFFGYILILAEAFLSTVFHIFKVDNFRMVINSSLLDVFTVIFIIYFAVLQYKGDIKALGVSFKNFLKNVYYGVVGYIALVPVLILILVITVIILNITKYVPPRQPVVELFLKEKNVTFLAYSSLFAAIVGPIIEELFFRGFMYGALKKYIGIFWSMAATAAVFAALHTHIVGFFPIMAIGILLAYLYEKTGTLVSSITAHIIHNLSMVFLVFLVKQVGVI